MKIKFLNILVIVIALFLYSCNNSFDPLGDFVEGYTLYSIIDKNKDVQKVYIFQNYMPEDLNAEQYKQNRTINNANVKISDGINNFIFTDTTEFIEELGTEVTYYQNKHFSTQTNSLNISAEIPGKKTLSASINSSSKKITFTFRSRRTVEYDLFSDYEMRFTDESVFEFLPVLLINYKLIEMGDTTNLTKEIPTYYVFENGRRYASFPNLAERSGYKYSIKVIEEALRELATEHPGKKIKVINLTANVLQVSSPLNIYYATNKSARDGFTIKLQEPNITNIENGNGIFGSLDIQSVNAEFGKSWEGLFNELRIDF